MTEKGFPLCQAMIILSAQPAKNSLLDAGELLPVLQFVVERESEAVLDVVVRFAVLDLTDLVRIGVAPTLVALLGEAADIAQRLGPGVVRIECQTLGKAALEGGLQSAVVGDTFALRYS